MRGVAGVRGDRRRANGRSGGLGRSRIRLGVLLVVAALLGAGALAWFTPVVSVRSVQIDGAATVSEQQIRELLAIPSGRSMLRIDTAAAERRVAGLPKVHTVRVQRVFPFTVRVTLVERVPVLFYDSRHGAHLLDAQSVEFAVEQAPIGVPKLITEHPHSADPVTRAAVSIVAAMPAALALQVDEVVARSISDVSLSLKDGRTVLWGGADDTERKSAVVLPLLTRPGTVFDVSSPNLVTVK